MTRPNYYLLLELDCWEQSDEKIDAAIKKKLVEWSRDRNHPNKGLEAHQYLGFLDDHDQDGIHIPGIRRVMGDATLREEEAREARRIRLEQEKELFSELDRYIMVLGNRGYVFEVEVATLTRHFVKRLSEEQIRRRIKVPIRGSLSRNDTAKPVLDASTTRAIESRLRIAGKTSLYDFLELHPSSRRETLLDRSRDLGSAAFKCHNKTAHVTAQAELAGWCQRIFNDENERQRYDNTLAIQGLREMDGLIACAGATGVIDSATMDGLLREAQLRGASPEEAGHYIRAWVSKNNCVVQWSRGI